MTLQAKTTVNEVEIKGPFANKKTGNEFDAHIIKTPQGDFTQYVNKDKEPEITAGDSIEIFFNEKPGFKGSTLKQVIKLTKIAALTPETNTALEAKPTSAGTIRTSEPQTKTLTTSTSSHLNKDISMEVSGLLQALLNRGVPQGELEPALREVLNLKRRIARELEEKGSL